MQSYTLVLGAALVGALLLAGCTAPPPSGADGHLVEMKNTKFVPKELTINVGETVTWINLDGIEHTVTSDEGSLLDSGDMNRGERYEHTFTEPGTYTYHCVPHAWKEDGVYQNMVGTIVVTGDAMEDNGSASNNTTS